MTRAKYRAVEKRLREPHRDVEDTEVGTRPEAAESVGMAPTKSRGTREEAAGFTEITVGVEVRSNACKRARAGANRANKADTCGSDGDTCEKVGPGKGASRTGITTAPLPLRYRKTSSKQKQTLAM